MKSVVIAFIALIFSLPLQASELSAKVTLVSDYRYGGVSMTAGNPALQVELENDFGNGAFAGLWSSNIDYGDGSDVELDVYAGYSSAISSDWYYTVSLVYITQQGGQVENRDYLELESSLGTETFWATYGVSDNAYNTGLQSERAEVALSQPLFESAALKLVAAHYFGDYYGEYDVNNYWHYVLGIEQEFGGIQVGADYQIQKMDKADRASRGLFRNDNTLAFRIAIPLR